jgi:hypothetical protein
MKAPIALFVYNRPTHTKRTVEALLRNPEATNSDLFVFSDAARTPEKRLGVEAVRSYIAGITGFRSVTIRERATNFGLSRSIINGVTEVLADHEAVIVVEDDLVTSPHFLAYMNDGLTRFAGDERVISVHGYVYPVHAPLPEAFFLRGADCWGWATWRRGWALFNPDGQFLLDELRRQRLTRAFDFDGAYDYCAMLEAQIRGENDSWAVRWHASAFLANRLTLYPGRSLVHNIGHDGSGTHCDASASMDAALSDHPIRLDGVTVEPSTVARQAIVQFFRLERSMLSRVLGREVLKTLTVFARDWLPLHKGKLNS